MIWLSISAGALAATGVLAVLISLRPFRPQLADALNRIETVRAPVADHSQNQSKIANVLRRYLPTNVPALAIPYQDLALARISVEKYLSEKVFYAIGGVVVPLFLAGLLAVSGLAQISPLIVIALSLGIGIACYFAPDSQVKQTAATARVEFTRATAAYVELVAAERRRGAPAGHALMSASQCANSWVFDLIHQELALADMSGVTPWDALEALSARMGVPELAQTAQIVRLSSQDGASIYQALRARGKALRFELLAVDQAAANRDSEKMQVPIALLSLVVVGIMITPMLQGLLNL
jgi:Flp pilus assembly protein TadB